MRLYKYMGLNIRTYDSIKNHEFYFSGFGELNDPYELSIASEKHSRIGEIAVQLSAGENPAGIFCLSKNWDNLLMWQHYADGHRGIVIEFETDNDPVFFKNLIPVIYADTPPKDHDKLTIKEVIEVKHKLSCYEEEWRSLGLKGLQKINPSAVVSATLGFRWGSDCGDAYALVWPRVDFEKKDIEYQKNSIKAALFEHLLDQEGKKKIKFFLAKPERRNFKI